MRRILIAFWVGSIVLMGLPKAAHPCTITSPLERRLVMDGDPPDCLVFDANEPATQGDASSVRYDIRNNCAAEVEFLFCPKDVSDCDSVRFVAPMTTWFIVQDPTGKLSWKIGEVSGEVTVEVLDRLQDQDLCDPGCSGGNRGGLPMAALFTSLMLAVLSRSRTRCAATNA